MEPAIAAADPAVRWPQHRFGVAAGRIPASILRARHARPRPSGDQVQARLKRRQPPCHSRASGNPDDAARSCGPAWIPACAGMTRAGMTRATLVALGLLLTAILSAHPA